MNRNDRLKQIQQRNKGFLINGNESLEIMRQNMLTIKQLFQSKNDLNNILSKKKILPFNFNKRNLEIGQWVDVEDTIEQWLEAEIIEVDYINKKVKIHYNGWSNRWDEWININSERINPFKTFTVQSNNSFFQSPYPNTQLDGDNSKIPKIKNDFLSTFTELKNITQKCYDTMNSIENLFDLKNNQNYNDTNFELKFKKEKDNMKLKNENLKNNIKIKKYLKNQKIIIKDNKYEKIDTFSNFSLKDKNFKNDNNSLKSLNIIKKDENLIENEKEEINENEDDDNNIRNENDSIISKSIKSNLSNNNLTSKNDFIYEKDIIIEENNDFENEFEKTINSNKLNSLNINLIEAELALKSAQIAPILDRLGRTLTDISPHFAIQGAKYIKQNNNNNVQNISEFTNDITLNSNILIGIFNRNNRSNNLNNNTISLMTPNINNENNNNQTISNNNNLQSEGINFQIPLMLNEGELNIINDYNSFNNEGNIDLNINAIVSNHNENSTSNKTFENKSTQTIN